MSFGHREWDQAQRDNPLCDAARRYLQLDCPQPLAPTLCDHIASHKRRDPADILDLATKGRLAHGDDDTLLLVRNSTAASHPSRTPLDIPVRIYVPMLARPQIMHTCHADTYCHLGVTRTLKMLLRFYWWIGMEACTKWWVRRCLKCEAHKTSRQTVHWSILPIPLPNGPVISISVD